MPQFAMDENSNVSPRGRFTVIVIIPPGAPGLPAELHVTNAFHETAISDRLLPAMSGRWSLTLSELSTE